MREAAARMFGPDAFSAGSFAAMQELTKKNFAAFNQALAMFSPFAGDEGGGGTAGEKGEIPRTTSTNCALSSRTCRRSSKSLATNVTKKS